MPKEYVAYPFLKIAWAHGFALEPVKGKVHIPVPPKTKKSELAY